MTEYHRPSAAELGSARRRALGCPVRTPPHSDTMDGANGSEGVLKTATVHARWQMQQTQGGRAISPTHGPHPDRPPLVEQRHEDRPRSRRLRLETMGQRDRKEKLPSERSLRRTTTGALTRGTLARTGPRRYGPPLRIAGIGPGDEVIVPSYTFISTATCIASGGGNHLCLLMWNLSTIASMSKLSATQSHDGSTPKR